ncbi:MAG: rhamnulokinase family protein, partial [Chthoniobacteraceae bacterium]
MARVNEQVHLGIDLGAESGRVAAGHWDGKRLRLEEVHRFPNGGIDLRGSLRWDVLRLWQEIQNGLALAEKRYGKSIASIGVDAWGVDFVLLSHHGELLGLPCTYRDPRTRGVMERAFSKVPREEIFAATGIQFMPINTLYQLLAVAEQSPELFDAAETFLTIPDFFNWCLTGERACEFTNATTTQCVHPITRDWSRGIIKRLGLPTRIFPGIIDPGTKLGSYHGIPVIAPATHDTGSAVVAVPMQTKERRRLAALSRAAAHTGTPAGVQGGEDAAPPCHSAYLSSGTWSLLGVELPAPILTDAALRANLTNEGGVDGTVRLLKNIMGLWLVQQCRRAFTREYDYAELVRLAAEAPALRSLVDPDDPRFLNPPSMPEAIREFCRETNQPVPGTDAAIIRCALESLALKYAQVLDSIDAITGTRAEVIHIV